jgi:hypothetical protein
MEKETATTTERAGIEKAIEAKKVEINALERKQRQKSDESMGISEKVRQQRPFWERTVGETAKGEQYMQDVLANCKEINELGKVKAAKEAELKELMSKLASLPK